jgi:uncharacterized Zn finger protein
MSKAGRSGDAESALWRAFEKAPSLELYLRLCKLGGESARKRALKFLEGRVVGEKRARWRSPADLLVEIQIEEKMFAAAWATAGKHGVSIGLKAVLAEASEATHPREALEVYAERVEQFANGGINSAYAEAAKLIAHMATLQNAGEQTAYVAALKVRHARKRNFMKLLG